jgi:AAA domain
MSFCGNWSLFVAIATNASTASTLIEGHYMTLKVSPATCGSVPIILFYGPEGRGKTMLASKFKNSVAALFERGLPRGVTIDAMSDIGTFAQFMEAIRDLYRDPQGYQTLVVYTLDSLEPLVLDHVCAQHNWKNIESPSFGKGYVAADAAWQGFIKGVTALRDRGMTIVMVAHSTIERIDDPRVPSYTSHQPKLHKRARHLILDACDVVGFLDTDLRTVNDEGGFRERTRAAGTNQRQLFLEGTPAFAAKNRFGMPAKMPIPLDFDIADLTAFWQKESHDHKTQ